MDLLAAQAESGQQQHDGAVAAPGHAIAMHGSDQLADLCGREVARRTVFAPGRDLRHARHQIAAGQPGGEHEAEHPSQIGRLLLQILSTPRDSRWQGQEGTDVLRPDTVQVAGLRPEHEAQKMPQELLALADRGPAQPPLQAQPVAIVCAQLLQPARWGQRFRLRCDDHTGADEMIDEPGEMGTSAATRVQRLRKGHCVVQFRQARSADVAGAKPARRHLFAKQVDGISKMTDGTAGVTEPLEFGRNASLYGISQSAGHGVEDCCVELVCEGMRRLLSWDEKGDRKGESSTAGNPWRHVPPGVAHPPNRKRLQHQMRANRLMLCRKIQTACACNQ